MRIFYDPLTIGLSAMGGLLAGQMFGGMGGGGMQAPPPLPEPEEPDLPTAEETAAQEREAQRKARRRQRLAASEREGRSDTLLVSQNRNQKGAVGKNTLLGGGS
jgi:hypothetical protein